VGQNFIPDTVNQPLLFPPSLHDWLPDGHLARFVVDVVSALDLDSIYASYREKDGRGQSAYAPEMMVRLLLYGYATGVYSSRKIERRTWEDVAFRYLSGDQHPDHATLSEFRKRHLTALAGLFTQALLLCAKAGLAPAGACVDRRDKDQGKRQQAQGDELQAHDRDRGAPEAGNQRSAGCCRKS
jgi:transposase